MPSAREFAFIGCRLLSLLILYFAVQQFELILLSLIKVLGADASKRSLFFFEIAFFPVLSVISDVVVILCLWCGAGWISGRLVKGLENAAKPEIWSREITLSLAVAALGLFILVTTIPEILRSIYVYTVHNQSTDESLIAASLAIAVAVICILGPRSIAGFVAKLRRW